MKPAAITMGCPVGIGPEIILRFFDSLSEAEASAAPVVLGDLGVLQRAADQLGSKSRPVAWQADRMVRPRQGTVPVLELSRLNAEKLEWGQPTKESATAMAEYIRRAAAGALAGDFSAIITCPISKKALNEAGIWHPGHTEMLAVLTDTNRYRMMMAGTRLRVVLVTIHRPLAEVSSLLTIDNILSCIRTTADSLCRDFALEKPRIAVAGFNPHGGEQGLFGREEIEIIEPAVRQYEGEAVVSGPWPPDTIFYKAANGDFDAVVCMYHDQGLIPFKLLHFKDGVNVTLGLPIVRTSVDHGTAYDIAGKGLADAASLRSAWLLAMDIARNRTR
jgi:4-hydroxythreonine-4-phosphate dehydrogenase